MTPRSAFVLLVLLVPCMAQAQTVLDRARRDVDTLAAPWMEGRGYEGEGHRRAAAYIERQFEEAGLAPVGGSYLLPFSFTVDLIRQAPVFALNGAAIPLGAGFLPIASSPSAHASGDARVVIAGSGLYAPDAGVNAYEGLDVRDAIVVLDDAMPSPLPEGLLPASRTTLYRMEAAAHFGARAVVFLTDNLSHGPFPQNTTLPGFLLLRSYWPAETPRIAYSLETTRDEETTSANVLAQCPGTRAADRYLVVMAHYDHLGRIGPDVFFPGANDNASGTALLLGLSRACAEQPFGRTVLFVAFSGEEQGLLGSRAFVADPPVPLEAIDFVLNLDMVASGEDGITVVGGSDFPEALDVLNAANAGVGISRIGKRANAPNSDHYPFLTAGIEGFFIYTNKGTQPYHSVNDVPATLEWDDFQAVYTLSERFLRAIDAR
ncbi:MAG: M28 family peptidase [Rhodothermales bacterium]